MRSRDSIIRILAALRAKFAEGSGCTVEEADAAVEQYNRLMQEYNIQETDIHIRQHGVGRDNHTLREKGKKQRPPIVFVLRAIGELSQTRVVWSDRNNGCAVFGTQADRDYAEFLIRVCQFTLENSWKAYRYSWHYTELKEAGEHGRRIRHAFETTVVSRLSERMLELAAMNRIKGSGTSLIVLKNELIQAFLDQQGFKTQSKEITKSYSGYETTVAQALNAANNAQLQHRTENQTRLLEKGGD